MPVNVESYMAGPCIAQGEIGDRGAVEKGERRKLMTAEAADGKRHASMEKMTPFSSASSSLALYYVPLLCDPQAPFSRKKVAGDTRQQ